MKKKSGSRSAFFNLRALFGFVLTAVGVFLALVGLSVYSSSSAQAQSSNKSPGRPIVVPSYHNDVSQPLRDMPAWPEQALQEHEAAENPLIVLQHKDMPDLKVDKGTLLGQLAPSIPSPILNFAGIQFPGVVCNCAPPDTNGEVGATQYVQIVNEGYQVFNKTTGASQLGPVSIVSLWSGFGGVCQTSGDGDPVVLYDQIANRWVISQFAGAGIPTDECIAVSTTSDATGSYNRYAFHLGSTFFDYPHLGVWPDAYYMSMNIFNSSGTAYLGPQAFAFDRAKMLAGQPATFITFPPLGGQFAPFLPSDLDGSTLPPNGAPNSFVLFPDTGNYDTYHFHADFANPSSSTFTHFSSPTAAGFTQLCPGNRNCIPQLGGTTQSGNGLDAIADRLMFRLAYRNFGDHEALVGNFTVSVSGVAGIRWFELRGVSNGPETVFQEGTYSPDSTHRWLGSVAQDGQGNMAVGFSASSATIFPQIRYAGRLKNDPIGTLGQGEAHLYDGTGAQVSTGNRWGDYSDLTIDPVDDSTFWYTNEYYDATSSFNWRTRIGSFKIATGGSTANLVSAASRLSHRSAGTFDVDMPLTGTSGVEDRSSKSYLAVFTFDAAVTSGSVSVTGGTATVGAVTFNGNEVRAVLTGVTPAEVVTLKVQNVNNDGKVDGTVPFGFLTADVDANRVVAKKDQQIIKAANGQTVNATNFRDDLDLSGVVDRRDSRGVARFGGNTLP
jgi:hypothetical protein